MALRLAAACLLLLQGAAAAAPDALDLAVLDGVLKAAGVTAPGRQKAWPGFDLLAQPVLLYRDNGLSFLLNHPSRPEGFADLRRPDLPGFKIQVSTIPRGDLRSVFYTGYRLADADVFALTYAWGDDPRETANTVVHERFHVFQDGPTARGGFKRTYTGAGLLPSDIKPENLALAAAEEALLASALRAGTDYLEPLKDFIAVRLERRRLFGKLWGVLDNDQERLEGTAEYLAGLVDEEAHKDGAFTPSALAARLGAEQAPEETAEHLLHGRQYLTGAAICLLLDRLAPGWKRKVAGDSYPFEALREAVPLPAADRRARLKALLASEEHKARLETARAALAALGEELARDSAAFRDHRGHRLVVRAEHTPDAKVSYSAVKTHKLDSRTELFVANPLYEFATGDVQLLVKDSTLQVYSGEDGLKTMQVLLSSAPAVLAGGKTPVLSASPAEFLDVSVDAPGVALRAKKALLQRAGDLLAVDIPR